MGNCIIISTTSKNFIESYLQSRLQELSIEPNNAADFLHLDNQENQSIGIKQVRILKIWAQTKPYAAAHKLAWLENAQLLTSEAQNSLLKLLEEPPAQTYIVLSCDNHKKLLPTVNSRCQVISNQDEQIVDNFSKQEAESTVKRLKKVEQLLSMQDKAARNTQIMLYLQDLLLEARHRLFHDSRSEKHAGNIVKIHETLAAIEKNATPRLALESLIINLLP